MNESARDRLWLIAVLEAQSAGRSDDGIAAELGISVEELEVRRAELLPRYPKLAREIIDEPSEQY